MSFMYKPFPFDDMTPVNRPAIKEETAKQLVTGFMNVTEHLARQVKPGTVIAIDGYTGADFDRFVSLLEWQLCIKNQKPRKLNIRDCYKTEEELWNLVDSRLSWDRTEDPTLLFGWLYKGGYEGLMDEEKAKSFLEKVREPAEGVTIVYGPGCLSSRFRNLYSCKVWLDVTPKESILRIRDGKYVNLGMKKPQETPSLSIRRCYYCDFEVAVELRRELFSAAGNIDFYVANDCEEEMKLLPWKAFDEIMGSLSHYPFRCKPVYLEGVWGGTYMKKLRGLPEKMRNAAWVFDLIPMEVSLLVEVGKTLVEFPFSTFFMKEGNAVLGPAVVKKFGGYFPIRFNWDDSYHSTGNMSIQCHSGSTYNKEHYNEFGRQDESYYVVITGHEAKTFIGWRDDADIPEFFRAIEAADTEHKPVDYLKYVSYEPSVPGLQVMLPAGTIHSSGRNQVILEIGSLTIGSYTYKMYDYLRLDFDGKQRPIHTKLGELNVNQERRHSVIHDPRSKDYIVQEPRLAASGEGWEEYIVGENGQLYFSLRRLEFEKSCQQKTDGKFHVLTLVDGEKIRIQSKAQPERFYEASFMDIVVVPAEVGEYEIINLGQEPVRVHKTLLAEGYEDVEL